MRRVLAVAVVVAVMVAAGLSAGVIVPRVEMVQPLGVSYDLGGCDGYTVLVARNEQEARLMLRGLLGEAPFEIVAISPVGGPVGVRRDGYVPVPPPPFRSR